MYQRILVALDQSEQSHQTFKRALDLATTNHARLMLLHVISPIDEGFPSPIYPISDGLYPMHNEVLVQTSQEQFSKTEKLGIEMLRSYQAKASAAGVCSEFNQTIGDPGADICAVVKSWKADLVVMGRRGRSGFSEFLLGSVSNHVMHHAGCSVLVVQEALVTA